MKIKKRKKSFWGGWLSRKSKDDEQDFLNENLSEQIRSLLKENEMLKKKNLAHKENNSLASTSTLNVKDSIAPKKGVKKQMSQSQISNKKGGGKEKVSSSVAWSERDKEAESVESLNRTTLLKTLNTQDKAMKDFAKYADLQQNDKSYCCFF